MIGRNDNYILDGVRKYFLKRSAVCLTYNEPIAREVRRRYGGHAVSFNNTEVCERDFRVSRYSEHDEVRLLFVGRYQVRKRLDRLIDLVARRGDIKVRLVGPDMQQLHIPSNLTEAGQIEVIGRTVGSKLDVHFDWTDLVANPGHVGLLAMNAARYGKGIVIDSESQHAPEHWMAKEAQQPFINWSDSLAVDNFIDDVKRNRSLYQKWGRDLQMVAKDKYTVEAMVDVYLKAFKGVKDQPADIS